MAATFIPKPITVLLKKGNHRFVVFISLILCFMGSASKMVVSSPDEIELKPTKFPFKPTSFYIADVVDARQSKAPFARLVAVPAPGKPASDLQEVNLKGGVSMGIQSFILQAMPPDKKLHPIIIHIKELSITEKPGSQIQVEGKIAVRMGFYLKRNGEEIHLLDYEGGANYGRGINQRQLVGTVLSQSLTSTMNYLNTWMKQQADKNEKLAKGLKVVFTEPTHLDAPDTVFYNPNRPLNWNDFKAKPNGKSNYAATVFPGFGYKGSSKVIDGIVHVNLMMQVFMVQQGSWVKEAARNAYTLNHEQKHFDLVKLVAERFKNRVHPDSLTIEDYNSIIQYKYIEAYREMNRLQEQYDKETRHGIDKEAQAQWDKRIASELKKLGVE